MLKFNSFTLNEINRYQVFLNELVSAGVTDIRAAQETVQRHLEREHRKNRSDERRMMSRKQRILSRKTDVTMKTEHQKAMASLPECPECGKSKMFPVGGVAEKILACPQCRFSTYKGE